MGIPNPGCPNAANHTPCPQGYAAWHTWADQMRKSHRQVKCPECHLYVIAVVKG
jgi:hypothetical protein